MLIKVDYHILELSLDLGQQGKNNRGVINPSNLKTRFWYSLYLQSFKAQVSLCICADLPESLLWNMAVDEG